jgi:hypothetical protein
MSTRNADPRVFSRAYVLADLPGLPGVPAAVGPVTCPSCLLPGAAVRHAPQGDGTYRARLECGSCGSHDLWTDAYAAGLAAGIIIEAARRGDPRVSREALTGGPRRAEETR